MERPDRVFTPMLGVLWNAALPYRDRHKDRMRTRPAADMHPATSAVPATLRRGPSCTSKWEGGERQRVDIT
jgi:hypothetical protein